MSAPDALAMAVSVRRESRLFAPMHYKWPLWMPAEVAKASGSESFESIVLDGVDGIRSGREVQSAGHCQSRSCSG